MLESLKSRTNKLIIKTATTTKIIKSNIILHKDIKFQFLFGRSAKNWLSPAKFISDSIDPPKADFISRCPLPYQAIAKAIEQEFTLLHSLSSLPDSFRHILQTLFIVKISFLSLISQLLCVVLSLPYLFRFPLENFHLLLRTMHWGVKFFCWETEIL